MTRARLIKKRNATIAVSASAEIVMMPGGDVNRWSRKFVGQLRARTIKAAPVHNYAKRPLRPHPGKHLNETIRATAPKFRSNGVDRQRIYAAVGSTASYAAFVDQGTEAHLAKILPPWAQYSGSLYEAGWAPGNRKPLGPIMVRGQKARYFFDEALKDTMRFMRLSAFQTPSFPRIGEVFDSMGDAVNDVFQGNDSSDPAFVKRLNEWREWRDDAFQAGEQLGRDHMPGRLRRTVLANQAQVERDRRRNTQNYLSTRKAADVRKSQQVKSIAAEKARKAEAERKRKEAERKKNRESESRVRQARISRLRIEARVKAQKLANSGYSRVQLFTIRDAKGNPDGFAVTGVNKKGETIRFDFD